MKENKFQSNLIKKIKERFPNSIVLKNDPNYCQGIPDLLILNGDKWAALECKKDPKSAYRPNQQYYVDTMNDMSYARFVTSENCEEVLDDLERSFKGSTRRKSRVSRRINL